MEEREGYQFPSTCWKEISAAANLDSPEGRAALGQLVQRYEGALTAYLRKKFCDGDQHHAKELFHRFLAEIVVARGLVSQAKPAEGHQFRGFMLRALHNFVISDFRKEFAEKRHPSGGIDSLEARLDQNPNLPCPAQEVNFDLEWAKAVVAKAVGQMHRECAADHLPHVWDVFESRLLDPLLNGTPEISYSDLVAKLGFTNPAQAHNALVTAKRKFALCLRSVIGEYVSDQSSIDHELRELMIILQHNR